MKRQMQTLVMVASMVILFVTSASAQITSSDALGIYPLAQASFDPLGRFTAIGESGGVPGQTVDGCDLYGFRAQTSINRSVNLGMRFIPLGPVGGSGTNIPTLQFESNTPFWIIEKNALGNETFGCGTLLATFKKTTTGAGGNNVFTIIGSGTASGGIWQPSDRTLKRDITAIPDALEIVKNLKGVTYEYLVDERPELNLPKGRTYGFITQEVEQVMPEAVRKATDEQGEEADYNVMQYTQIIPVLTEAIKAQQKVIETQEDRLAEQFEWSVELQDQLAEQQAVNAQTQGQLEEQKAINASLEDRLRRLEAALSLDSPASAATTTAIISAEGISLRQNRPNPFQGETVIEYAIPSEMNNAQLAVYDLNGKVIAQFALAAGNGQVTLNAATLSSGVYFYAIENSGQTLARQKMIVK